LKTQQLFLPIRSHSQGHQQHLPDFPGTTHTLPHPVQKDIPIATIQPAPMKLLNSPMQLPHYIRDRLCTEALSKQAPILPDALARGMAQQKPLQHDPINAALTATIALKNLCLISPLSQTRYRQTLDPTIAAQQVAAVITIPVTPPFPATSAPIRLKSFSVMYLVSSSFDHLIAYNYRFLLTDNRCQVNRSCQIGQAEINAKAWQNECRTW